MTGLPEKSATPIAQLAATGANCCLCHDETMLVGVPSITPVPIGVATLPDQEADSMYCANMGYLPLTCADDSIHMQPFYCNHKTSGIIMSPECIMVTSPDIVTWFQTGHRDKNESDHLVIIDKDEQVVLKLDLQKMDGLYYSWMDSYATDNNPIRVHTVHDPQSTPLPHWSGSPPHPIEDSEDDNDDDDRSVQLDNISIDSDSSRAVEVMDNIITSRYSNAVPPNGSPSNPTPARRSAGSRVSHRQPTTLSS